MRFPWSKSNGLCRRRREVKGLEDMKKEIAYLHKEVGKLRIMIVAAGVIMAITIINFQIQYSQIHSYYQSTVESNQDILLNQEVQLSELQRFRSVIEGNLPD